MCNSFLFCLFISQEKRTEVEEIVGMKVNSFLCVPVTRKGSNDLIALACLVNKAGGHRSDHHPALQFDYVGKIGG